MRRPPSSRMRFFLFAAAALLVVVGPSALAQDEGFLQEEEGSGLSLDRIAIPLDLPRPWGRGPLPLRDAMPLSAMRLALHPFSPDTALEGEPRGRVEATWSNTFLDNPDSLVDSESLRAAFEVRDGVADGVDAGIEIPVVFRGGGTLDSVANFLHDAFGAPDGDRGESEDDRHEIVVIDDGRVSDLDSDSGLGDVIVSSKARLHEDEDGLFAVALLTEMRLPTAADDLGADGFDVGATLGLSARLLESVFVYGGAGGTWFSDDRHEGFRFEPFRGYGFAAIEWQIFDWASLLLQADAATPLLEGPDGLDGWQSYVHMGAVADLGETTRLELAFVENLEDQDATADFALFAGVGFTF